MMTFSRMACATLAAGALSVAGCSGPKAPAPTPCDRGCQDATALRGVREMMKLAFNITLQGKDVGPQDGTMPCIRGGSVHVHGDATSNALQGTTDVKLTYEFDKCAYRQKDADPTQSYDLTITGKIDEQGTIAVQGGATSALILGAKDLAVSGQVYDPPIAFDEKSCNMDVSQSGNRLGGTFCGRDAAVTF